jgi:hypothetical protein
VSAMQQAHWKQVSREVGGTKIILYSLVCSSVFAVFPNGAVVHYSCKEKIEQTQWKLAW